MDNDNKPYLQWQKSDYENLLLVPIYVIVASTYLVTGFFMAIRLLSWKKDWMIVTKLKEADRKIITYMLETFFNMLHHREGIRDLNPTVSEQQGVELQEKSTTIVIENSPEEHKLPVHSSSPGHVINTENILRSKWAMTLLSFYVASVASLALVVFWDEFVVEETTPGEIDSNADCYTRGIDGTYSLVNFSDPRVLDSILKGNLQLDLCYDLGLDFPRAIAEVAGILFLASNGFAFLMFLLLLAVDGIESRCYRIMLYVAMAISEYLCAGLIMYAFAERYELRGGEDTKNLIIEESLITYALLMGVTTPWLLLLWASKRWTRKRGRVIDKQLNASYYIRASDALQASTLL